MFSNAHLLVLELLSGLDWSGESRLVLLLLMMSVVLLLLQLVAMVPVMLQQLVLRHVLLLQLVLLWLQVVHMRGVKGSGGGDGLSQVGCESEGQ